MACCPQDRNSFPKIWGVKSYWGHDVWTLLQLYSVVVMGCLWGEATEPKTEYRVKLKPPNEEGGHITVTRHTWRDVAATSRHVDVSHVTPRGRPPKKRLSPESSRLAL